MNTKLSLCRLGLVVNCSYYSGHLLTLKNKKQAKKMEEKIPPILSCIPEEPNLRKALF